MNKRLESQHAFFLKLTYSVSPTFHFFKSFKILISLKKVRVLCSITHLPQLFCLRLWRVILREKTVFNFIS